MHTLAYTLFGKGKMPKDIKMKMFDGHLVIDEGIKVVLEYKDFHLDGRETPTKPQHFTGSLAVNSSLFVAYAGKQRVITAQLEELQYGELIIDIDPKGYLIIEVDAKKFLPYARGKMIFHFYTDFATEFVRLLECL